MSEDDVFYELLRKGARFSASKDYVSFDEIEDVLVSVDLVALVAPLVSKIPSYWKWVIVSAHNALQGAMVCALRDSTGTSVLTEKSERQMLEWLQDRTETRGNAPRERPQGAQDENRGVDVSSADYSVRRWSVVRR